MTSAADPLLAPLLTMRKWKYHAQRYAAVWFEPMQKQDLFFRSTAKERFLSGGVRSGKTEAAAADLALQAWGVKGLLYPGFPADGKARHFWAIALSVDKQRDTVKKKLRKFLGPYARWRESEHTFVLPQGSTVTLKSQEADEDKFQSADIDGAWFDEIGKDGARYEHVKDRCIDHGGRVWTSFAPTRGMGWYFTVYDRWREQTNDLPVESGGILFIRLFTEDNRFIPQAEVADRKKRITSESDLRVKFYGEMVELRGLVYPSFDPERHVIRCLVDGKCSVPPPPNSTLYRGHDYGLRYPAATVWLAMTHRDRDLVVYRGLYETGLFVPQLCMRIRQLSPKEERIALDVADPALWNREPMEGAQGGFVRLKDLYHEHGIPVVPGNHEWQTGTELVSQMLGQRGEKPRLRIHECCRDLVREFRLYHWPEGGSPNPAARTAMGRDDAIDALRYVVVALKPYLDGADPAGGFEERQEDHGGFDGQEAVDGGAPATPTAVERIIVGRTPDGREIHQYRARWTSGTPESAEDGFNPP